MTYKIYFRKFRRLMGTFLVLVAGCQSYSFEEVPSSSFSEKRWIKTLNISSAVDILFVVDNSYSMAGEQRQIAESFQVFASTLEEFFGQDYRIAIVSTGMTSQKCSTCQSPSEISCINETGETGKFQDRVGKNVGTDNNPQYEFEPSNPDCRVVTYENKDCFYDATEEKGTVFVGITGCGYERGLAPLRLALDTLANDYNKDFLRENATLAVVIISDEEDCGEVGDVSEGTNYSANICYYASKGVDPYGETEDPNQKPYSLTPVKDYYDFLLGLKGNQKNMVKFAAIVGVTDVKDPTSTTIEYYLDNSEYKVQNACVTAEPDCQGNYCNAFPGTRYIQLADMFGLEEGGNGFIDTICQNDFSETMEKLGGFIRCPEVFSLSEPIRDPALANILINDEPVPRYSCSVQGQAQKCSGPEDTSCPQGECVPSWDYTPPKDPPDSNAMGGTISFRSHYDPCELFEPGDEVRIELIYVVE